MRFQLPSVYIKKTLMHFSSVDYLLVGYIYMSVCFLQLKRNFPVCTNITILLTLSVPSSFESKDFLTSFPCCVKRMSVQPKLACTILYE